MVIRMEPVTTYLIETTITLAVVSIIAIAVLAIARRLGSGKQQGPIRLVGRLPVDARRSVLLVQVANQVLILGASEAGITRLGDLPEGVLSTFSESAPATSFSNVLARIRSAIRPSSSTLEARLDIDDSLQAPSERPHDIG